jgi:hypothetical protein
MPMKVVHRIKQEVSVVPEDFISYRLIHVSTILEVFRHFDHEVWRREALYPIKEFEVVLHGNPCSTEKSNKI